MRRRWSSAGRRFGDRLDNRAERRLDHHQRFRVLAAGRTLKPRDTRAKVREEVRRRIGDLAPGGGYVLCGVHNLQQEVPPENVVAMYEAALEFGG
jgi:hypothetical protein